MQKLSCPQNPCLFPSKNGLDMPQVTLGDKRITNIVLNNGDYIQGIRRNADLIKGGCGRPVPSQVTERGILSKSSVNLPPLRYTPGLSCDPHMESLRPERNPEHQAIQGGNWKQKLISPPQSYAGSFADANLQNFRPHPQLLPMEDPWYASRMPDQTTTGYVDRLDVSNNNGLFDNGQVFGDIYHQDELSLIKLRNRRFQAACFSNGVGNISFNKKMMCNENGVPHSMPLYSQFPQDESNFNDLNILNNELNQRRRAIRPFVPTNAPEYWELQRQINLMEQPKTTQEIHKKEALLVEDLPIPKKIISVPQTEAFIASDPSIKNRNKSLGVNIADQIAIRSFFIDNKEIASTT